MSELKVRRHIDEDTGIVFSFYGKSEADKFIADLEESHKLKKAGRSLRQNINHQKYKRCMAMAQVLEHVCPITNRKAKWRDKWHKRWLELAEKFKEA